MIKSVIFSIAYVLLAPLSGGLLSGIDRVISARMQGRHGPPVLQPFYDIYKLFSKEHVAVNHVQDFLVVMFLFFIIFSGGLFFWGGDMLLVFFSLTLSEIFFVMAAFSSNSPYSFMGSQRELVQMMAYEPMILLTAIGFYMAEGSFAVKDIVGSKVSGIAYLPGIFVGFLFILTIKFRKSPFDISSSHHAHQEVVRGVTTEFSGRILGFVELSHWYENVLMLGIIGLFIINSAWWSVIIAVAVCIAAYFLETLIDNIFPRVKWQEMLKSTWIVIALAAVVNMIVLSFFI